MVIAAQDNYLWIVHTNCTIPRKKLWKLSVKKRLRNILTVNKPFSLVKTMDGLKAKDGVALSSLKFTSTLLQSNKVLYVVL